MQLLSLTCQHCGAPLEVPAKTAQFECLYCGSRLHVQWADSIALAKALEDAAPKVANLIKSPEQLRIEETIALLDDAWETVRRRFMLHSFDNRLSVPDKNSIQLTGVFGVLLGVAAIAIGAIVLRAPSSLVSGNDLVGYLMPLFGTMLIISIVAWCRHAWKKADDFEVHQHAYQSERQRLLAELESSPYAVAHYNR